MREVGVREVGVREVGVREGGERKLEVFMGESALLAANLPSLTGVSRASRPVRAIVARTWRVSSIPVCIGALV